MKLFFKCVLLVFVGLGVSLSWLSHNPSFKKRVHETVSALAQENCNAQVLGNLSHLSLLHLSATFTDISLQPLGPEKNWSCAVGKCDISCSLWPLLRFKKVGVRCSLKGVEIFSECHQNRCALVDHCRPLLAQEGQLPVLLQSLDIQAATIRLEDSVRGFAFEAALNSTLQGKDDLKLYVEVLAGQLVIEKKQRVTGIHGKVVADVGASGVKNMTCDLSCLVADSSLTATPYYLSGVWNTTKGTAIIHNQDRSLLICPCTLERTDEGLAFHLQMMFPVKELVRFFYPSYVTQATGLGSAQVTGLVGGTITGTVTCQEGGWGAQRLEKLEGSFSRTKEGNIQGLLKGEQGGQTCLIQWAWNESKKRVRFAGKNETALTLFGTDWEIAPEKLMLKGTIAPDLTGNFSYAVRAENKKTESCVAAYGKSTGNGTDWKHTGTLLTNERDYTVTCSSRPFSLTICQQEDQAPVLDVSSIGSLCFARIEAALIKNLLKEYGEVDYLVKGTLLCEAFLQKNGVIEGSITFEDGIFRKPDMYNFIHSLQADFVIDLLCKQLALKNVAVGLQKGKIESSSIKCGYDSSKKEWWAHAPFLFTDCFINWKKDLYVLFSGALVAQKRYGASPELKGFITLDKSQLKENIFSQETQQELMSAFVSSPSTTPKQGITLDLALLTRVPLVIKTPQLETNALLALSCKGTGDQTEFSGDIFFQGGMIHFPAYSLPLIKGKLSFAGDSTADPLIELVAQGHVKKYVVTLCVGGTAQDPQIVFDSSPSLSEEQIMMLLVAGSQEGSLNSIAPALVMHAVLFGTSYKTRNEPWLEPLKRIKFVPKFTDQTGRGGFKGALEIEVNKRLRAVIEKNFSLTEDVAFEVEYALTDEVSVKGGVDERGDLGALLEMRFKF